MNTVFFSLRSDVTEEARGAFLQELTAWPGVKAAHALHPASRSAVIRRQCFVELQDDADADRVAGRLRGQPEVEDAAPPAERRATTAF